MSFDPEPIIARYLKLIDKELRGLPRDRRREVVHEIAEHIAQAREAEPIESEAQLLNLLTRIGAPSEIAAESRERIRAPTSSRSHEIGAIILLLLGGFVFVVGWFVGVILLWTSQIWTLRDKLIGTLLLPGGLAFSLVFLINGMAAGFSCSSDPRPYSTDPSVDTLTTCNTSSGTGIRDVAVIAIVVLAPIGTSIYLAQRLAALAPTAGEQTGGPGRSFNTIGWVVLAVVLILVAFVWLASQTLISVDNGS